MGVGRTHSIGRRVLAGFFLAALLVLMGALVGCGSEDTGAVQSCGSHIECPLGTSCNFENKCVQASCEDCKSNPDLICLVNEDNPEGVCSRPECTSDDQCDTAAGESCNEGLCTAGGAAGCENDRDCEAGETCNLKNECVPDSNRCTDSTDCANDEICDENNECVPDSSDPCGGCDVGEVCNTDTNRCEADQSCDPACTEGETCNPETSQCEPEQTCDPACTDGQICDTSTGTCVENTCPPGTPAPSDCAGDPVYNKFNPDGCFCAQCLSDSDCDTAAGETCNPNGECMTCNETCDPADGGNACSDPGFYCVSDCCVECLGNADCASGEVCVDGSCGAPPDCSVDPSVCTGGTVCDQQTQTCVPPDTGSSCSTQADCQDGQFCNNGQCESLTGGGGGQTCDPPCTGNSTCTLGMCTGCQSSSDCPSGSTCVFEVCLSCADLGLDPIFCSF